MNRTGTLRDFARSLTLGGCLRVGLLSALGLAFAATAVAFLPGPVAQRLVQATAIQRAEQW